MPHRDTVRHRDRAELQWVPVRLVHALLGGLGQPVQREVARGDLVPGAGDPDLRLAPVVVPHPDRAEHATRGGAFDAVGDDVTVRLAVLDGRGGWSIDGRGDIGHGWNFTTVSVPGELERDARIDRRCTGYITPGLADSVMRRCPGNVPGGSAACP